MKQYVFAKNEKEIRQMIAILDAIYKSNHRPLQNKHNHILLKRSNTIASLFKVYCVFVSVSIGSFFFLPFVLFGLGIEAKLGYMLYTFLPLIDEKSSQGFLFYCVWHTLLLILATVAIINGDGCFGALMLHVQPMSEIFDLVMSDFNATMLDASRNPSNLQMQFECRYRLRNIIMMHKDIDLYVLQHPLKLDLHPICQYPRSIYKFFAIFRFASYTHITYFSAKLASLHELNIVFMISDLLEQLLPHFTIAQRPKRC